MTLIWYKCDIDRSIFDNNIIQLKKMALGKKMGQEYNKLVRDRIPEIIRQNGSECEVVRVHLTFDIPRFG